MKHRPLDLITSATLFLSLGALLADSYKNSSSVYKYLGINSLVFPIVTLIVIALLRQFGYQLPGYIRKINCFIVLPLFSLLTIGMSLLDFYTPTNYVYDRWQLHFQQFGMIAVSSLVLAYLSLPIDWLKKRGKTLLFCLAILLFTSFLIMNTWPFNHFTVMGQEDGIIEWLQVVVLCFALGWAVRLTQQIRQNNYPSALFSIYVVVSLGLLLVIGDEISWGQRLLNIQTPEVIAQQNVQSEITLHNLEGIAKIIWQTYFVIGVYGTFGWLIKPMLAKKLPQWRTYLSFFIPDEVTVPFFLFLLVYQVLTRPGVVHLIGRWSEPMELFLYIALALFFWQRAEEMRRG